MALPNGSGSLPRKTGLYQLRRGMLRKVGCRYRIDRLWLNRRANRSWSGSSGLGCNGADRFGIGLQFGLAFDVAVEEFGAHAASRQTGNRHEFNHLFGFRTGQRFLEVDVGIAFFGYGKRGTDLNGGCAPVFSRLFDFSKFAMPPASTNGIFFAFQAQVF